jgi:pimeloyl-ACP methyl ester carboxylesterase
MLLWAQADSLLAMWSAMTGLDNNSPDMAITIVHGTWARFRLPFSSSPHWFEDGSEFVSSLRRELDLAQIQATITPFLWSGANSIAHRAAAAIRLANHVRHCRMDQPNAVPVVIGHSHGGSICLLSLQTLPSHVRPVVVTLATPFMEVIRSDSSASGAAIRKAAQAALLGPVLLFSYLMNLAKSFDSDLAIFVPILICLCVFTVTALFPSSFGVPAQQSLFASDWMGEFLMSSYRYETLTKGGSTIDGKYDVLIVRGVDDEAGMVLSAGSIGTRLSSIGLLAAIRVSQFFCLIYFVLCGVLLAGSLFGFFIETKNIITAIVTHSAFLYPACASIILFCVLPIVACLFKSVYGRELAGTGFFCDIKSASSPDIQSELTTVTLPPSAISGMRHGIYQHELCASTIVKFLARTLAR